MALAPMVARLWGQRSLCIVMAPEEIGWVAWSIAASHLGIGSAVKKTVNAAHDDFLVETASGLRWKTMFSSELSYLAVGRIKPA